MIAEHELIMRHLELKAICPSNPDGSSWLVVQKNTSFFYFRLVPMKGHEPFAKESSTSHQPISTATVALQSIGSATH